MKTLIKVIPAMLLMTLISSSVLKAQSEEIIIQTTAQCKECEEIIEKALLAEKGVRYADLDVKSKKAKVIYNPKRTNPDKLRKAISMAGYDADDIAADSAAVLKLDPCCTKDGHRE